MGKELVLGGERCLLRGKALVLGGGRCLLTVCCCEDDMKPWNKVTLCIPENGRLWSRRFVYLVCTFNGWWSNRSISLSCFVSSVSSVGTGQVV